MHTVVREANAADFGEAFAGRLLKTQFFGGFMPEPNGGLNMGAQQGSCIAAGFLLQVFDTGKADSRVGQSDSKA